MAKKRYFVLIAHCLLNPSSRVNILGKRHSVAKIICDYFLSKNISIVQLPCPEFTAMGYGRNPQGRVQYDNVFFRKHCRKELEEYVDMALELKNNGNNMLCFLGVQGSPTCSIYWGRHKVNKYHKESINEEEGNENKSGKEDPSQYGVMTCVLKEMLQDIGINVPFLEVPLKENIEGDKFKNFFDKLDDLLHIPAEYKYDINNN